MIDIDEQIQLRQAVVDDFVEQHPEFKDNAWHYKDVQDVFEITSFGYCIAFCTRKSDGVKGTLDFDRHNGTRIYFGFRPRRS